MSLFNIGGEGQLYMGALLAAAAAIALLVVDLTDRDELRSARVVDVLTAAAQGDDLSLTPATAAAEIRAAVARARLDAGVGDPFAARSAATTAVLEVLDPASGEVALQEVLLRATWAALRSRQPERVLEFLLAADEAFEAAANA
jgi:hypothetical protein